MDTLSPTQRALCMSRVRQKDTDIECLLRSALHRRGLRFRKHSTHLPGKPDVVFIKARVAIFVDGDFWHGYRYPSWQHTLAPFWRDKIERNRRRDRRTFARLRRLGWKPIRVWQHQIQKDLIRCVDRITRVVSNPARTIWAP
jgi:DNA mismatch endonuclease, patch repair protein